MIIINSKNQCFPLYVWTFRIKITGNFRQNGPIEGFRDNLTVERFYIEVQFIFQAFRIGDLTCHRVILYHRIAFLVVDPLFAQFGSQFMGSIVVNQIPLNHCLTVCIFKDRLAKDLGCL